ncbi:hypothetical protein [Archangium lipolyticum]|uniref:hypothetical protein n=1 Tax=Archangium lipolyticum TaxID=2970465 RepID=UPI00214A63B4|nr:hypothetical protein [Archangium lipolyticum]
MAESRKRWVLDLPVIRAGGVLSFPKDSAPPRDADQENGLLAVADLDALREQARVSEELLAATLPRSDEWIALLRWKITWSRHFLFTGQLLPLVGGAAALTQLTEASGLMRNLMGMLTILGSVVGLLAQHVERTLLPGHTASEFLPQLVEARARGERLLHELQLLRNKGQDLEAGRELIQQAHRVAYTLQTLGPIIGGGPWRGLVLRLGTRLLGAGHA